MGDGIEGEGGIGRTRLPFYFEEEDCLWFVVGGLELGGFDVVMVDVCEVMHEMHKFSVVLCR